MIHGKEAEEGKGITVLGLVVKLGVIVPTVQQFGRKLQLATILCPSIP